MFETWTDSTGVTHVEETADCGDFPGCHDSPPTCGH